MLGFVCLSWKLEDSFLFCAHEKESGERNDCRHVRMCVGCHTATADVGKNDTFLLLLAGSKGEGTCERTEKPPRAVTEMRCWREQGFQEMPGLVLWFLHCCCPRKCVSPEGLGVYARRRRQLPEKGQGRGNIGNVNTTKTNLLIITAQQCC